MKWLYKVYSLVLRLLYLLILPLYLARVWLKKKERKTYLFRLGWQAPSAPKGAVLLHGVSLGEVKLAHLLAEEIRGVSPHLPVVISTVTDTGYQWLCQRKTPGISACVLPLDFPFLTAKFLDRLQPRAIGILETELWPALIVEASQRAIPLFLCNGRLSDGSFPKYLRLRRFLAPLLQHFVLIAVPSTTQAERFRALGGRESALALITHLKLNASPPSAPSPAPLPLPQDATPILLLASTHPQEEHELLNLLAPLVKRYPKLFVLIAPRHPERAVHLVRKCSFPPYSFSLWSSPRPSSSGLIIDRVGLLKSCYRKSDLAILGGTFSPIGGHNFLESLEQGTPILIGPHMENFVELVSLFSEEEGVYRATFETLLETVEHALQLGKAPALRGREKIVQQPRGTRQILQLLTQKLPHVLQ